MRIIRGSHKSRQINLPKNFKARPTTDIAKEALFTILENNYEFTGIKALDLFAGSGSISYEFASRGCAFVTAVELDFKNANFIKKTSEELDFQQIEVIKGDVFKFLKYPRGEFDIIFADPPYEEESILEIPDLIFKNTFLSKIGWLIIEHSEKYDFTRHPHFLRQKYYGKVNFSFFSLEKDT